MFWFFLEEKKYLSLIGTAQLKKSPQEQIGFGLYALTTEFSTTEEVTTEYLTPFETKQSPQEKIGFWLYALTTELSTTEEVTTEYLTPFQTKQSPQEKIRFWLYAPTQENILLKLEC